MVEKAQDENRTGDPVLTKDVLCRLSYLGPQRLPKSGKRGSNPRHSAWKADALPTELFPRNRMGREGFEPPKRFRNGFTARPIWPLWNLPESTTMLDALFKASERIRTPDPLITNQPLYHLSYAGAPTISIARFLKKMRKCRTKHEKWKNLLSSSSKLFFFQRVNLKSTERRTPS